MRQAHTAHALQTMSDSRMDLCDAVLLSLAWNGRTAVSNPAIERYRRALLPELISGGRNEILFAALCCTSSSPVS